MHEDIQTGGCSESRPQTATLKNWSFDPYLPILWGECYGHPHCEDGMKVHTARIEYLNEEETKAISLNTIWTLEDKE